jgi:integral membrane protein
MLKTVVGRFRLIGWLEGASFLLLLFVAMPLKYVAGMPQPVSYVGMAHGILFLLYVAAALHAWRACGWSLGRLGLAAGSSLVPFGPFLFDKFVLDDKEKS